MLSDVRGQTEGVHFLRRVVDQHFTSPLLLIGDDGVGRRFSVVQATKEMFCTGTREDSCPCLDCLQINQGAHPDFIILSPEGDKDIGVEAIRSLITAAGVYPTVAPYKVILIEAADRLTNPAANALLKTLEEPPRKVRFFLLAESQARVIPTIRSRCGLVSYNSLPEAMVVSVLQRFETDPDKALVYARLSEGSVGRAVRYWGSGRLVLRDQTFSLIRLALERDVAGLFSTVDSMDKELPQVLRFLSHLLHDLLMVHTDPSRLINLDLHEDLVTMSTRVDISVWHRFSSAVRALQERSRYTKMFMTFQVKALFAQTLVAR